MNAAHTPPLHQALIQKAYYSYAGSHLCAMLITSDALLFHNDSIEMLALWGQNQLNACIDR